MQEPQLGHNAYATASGQRSDTGTKKMVETWDTMPVPQLLD